MGFLKPKTPDRPLEEGMTPKEIAAQERRRRLKFAGSANTTVAGKEESPLAKKSSSDQKTALGKSV